MNKKIGNLDLSGWISCANKLPDFNTYVDTIIIDNGHRMDIGLLSLNKDLVWMTTFKTPYTGPTPTHWQ